jgi:hypothetical protein
MPANVPTPAPGVRRFFNDVQMATESGGRQLDDKGQPLVGYYRDGSTPPPEKRAYGAGQMQVGTARNVAAAHGIEWDGDKFYYDRDYNLRLANLHQGDLEKKYGDHTLALAAYHSGEPRVDAAIAKYGREGFAQGLGPEGRNYIKMGTPAKRTSFLDSIDDSLRTPRTPAEVKASQNVVQPAANIFGSDAELGQAR